MALIKFNQLNEDQYINEDIFYPDWEELFKETENEESITLNKDYMNLLLDE